MFGADGRFFLVVAFFFFELLGFFGFFGEVATSEDDDFRGDFGVGDFASSGLLSVIDAFFFFLFLYGLTGGLWRAADADALLFLGLAG